MKRILMVATGGTIASMPEADGTGLATFRRHAACVTWISFNP